MKRLKHLLLLLPFIGAAVFSFKPSFSDNDGHKVNGWHIEVPDSLPPYNGLYWAHRKGDTITISQYNSREYQIELELDSMEIWDGDRLVGKIINGNTAIDSLFQKDNE